MSKYFRRCVFIIPKKKIVALVFVLCAGSHPIVRASEVANDTPSFIAQVIGYFTTPQFVIFIINNFIMMGAMGLMSGFIGKKITEMLNKNRATTFCPVNKQNVECENDLYCGFVPYQI